MRPVVAVGLATAQMMALPARSPREETTVKNPGSCTEDWTLLVASATKWGEGEVCTCQVCNALPALVTRRLMPSDPWKYDVPHQQPAAS